MKTITFVRHGERVANTGGITPLHSALSLSPLEHRQAAVLADALDVVPSAVFVSHFLCTQETAAPFCQQHGTVVAMQCRCTMAAITPTPH